MARLGKQVKHFDMVDIENIKAHFSKCNTYRYLLVFNFKSEAKRDKILTVILKNPSSADEKAADNTIRRVQTFIYKNFEDVKSVNILNLFAIRATDTKDVNNLYNEFDVNYILGVGNNKYSIDAISKADYIITAWGGKSKIAKKIYDTRIDEVNALLLKHKKDNTNIYRVNSKKGSKQYPFHACLWGKNDDFINILG